METYAQFVEKVQKVVDLLKTNGDGVVELLKTSGELVNAIGKKDFGMIFLALNKGKGEVEVLVKAVREKFQLA